jgi:hypothetical protein
MRKTRQRTAAWVSRNCLGCGKEFATWPSQIKLGRGKYCSHACYAAAIKPKTDTATRFWANVEKGEGCWLWRGNVSKGGYGLFTRPKPQRPDHLKGKGEPAHRVAWELTHGAIAGTLQIDHLCRNKLCVNPAHMELVTASENTRRGGRPR